MRKLNKKGFTLIEAIVGAVVIALISLATWTAVTVMTKTDEMSRNRINAVNLLQQSQEEIRRAAQINSIFDGLETCQFPNPSTPPANTCGLSDITTAFPGYFRVMNVTRENGSTELKRVVTTVQWRESSEVKQMQSVILLSRPPEPLAGNLIGFVSSESQPAIPLGGIAIKVDLNSATASYTTTSAGAVDSKGANFNFADVVSGKFILPAGAYTLTVNDNRYFPYTHPTSIVVPSNGEVFVSLELEPKPDNAVIFGNVINLATGAVVNSFSGGVISLYQNGSSLNQVGNQRTYSFTVPFNSSAPRKFTLNTQDAFRAGYAYSVSSGGLPSCQFMFNREGYSTAVVQADNSLVCGNPYNGNAASDRINVFPGDSKQVDLTVTPVPEVLITGRVVNSSGNPIPNATIRARWPRSDGSFDWIKQGVLQTVTTNASGQFTFSVPAVQGMFPNSNPTSNFLQVWAMANVPVLSCCNLVQTEQRSSPTRFIGPLFPSDPARNIGDLVITVVDKQCGNVGGDVIDDFTKNNLPGVNVTVALSDTTDATGHYLIECSTGQTGYRIETGQYRFTGQRNGYYTNQSVGNDQYARRGSNGNDVNILTDTLIGYNARLWPMGTGRINVTVLDQTTGLPMDGVSVVFDPYFGANVVRTTSGGGVASFINVPETWPPPSVPNDGYYQMSPRNHVIQINHDPANYQPHTEVISNFNAGNTLNVTILLRRIGGV